MQDILSKEQQQTWSGLISNAQRIVIVGHTCPDGDAMGAALGLAEYFRAVDKDVLVLMPNAYPNFLAWLPKANEILLYDQNPAQACAILKEADLICLLDFNELTRIKQLGIEIAPYTPKTLVIDHHVSPNIQAALLISNPEMSSTSEMVFRILWQMGGYTQLSVDGATAIYCGMMTDTGGFTYNSTSPDIYFIISQLLLKGINKDKIYHQVYHNYSEQRLRLMGYILYKKIQIIPELHASYFTIDRQEAKRFNLIQGDTEGFVNLPLQIKDVRLSISLREEQKCTIRVSLRSIDAVPCNLIAAEYFNGGGHLNAAGGELHCSLNEAIEITKRAIMAYSSYLII